MWCRHCQQDVPALRPNAGAPACPRCRASLGPASEGGVDLASFDPQPAARIAPFDPWVLEADAFELRRIGRKLRPCVRTDAACAAPPPPAAMAPTAGGRRHDAAEVDSHRESPPLADALPSPDDRSLRNGAASVAADSGFLAMVLAAATMVAQHQGMIAAEYWRWGAIGAAIGGTVFALGVLRLATRAWQRGCELAAEIDSLRGEIATLRDAQASMPVRGGQTPFAPRTAHQGGVAGTSLNRGAAGAQLTRR
jgi:hypothetical protein